MFPCFSYSQKQMDVICIFQTRCFSFGHIGISARMGVLCLVYRVKYQIKFWVNFPFQSHYTKIRWWEKLMICFTSQHVNYDAEYELTHESYLCCWSWYSVLNVFANQLLKSLEHHFLAQYKVNSSHKCIFWYMLLNRSQGIF